MWLTAVVIVSTCTVAASLILSLREFFDTRVLIYLTTVYLMICGGTSFLMNPEGDPLVLAINANVGMFTSQALWDSRRFLIDTFSILTILKRRPAYVTMPISLACVLFAVHSGAVSVDPIPILVEATIAILTSEGLYNTTKRKHIQASPTNRRTSISSIPEDITV